jgi:transposase-like protein
VIGDNNVRKKVTQNMQNVTGKRYCSSCSRHMSLEGGAMVKTNIHHRWKCAECMEHSRKRMADKKGKQ